MYTHFHENGLQPMRKTTHFIAHREQVSPKDHYPIFSYIKPVIFKVLSESIIFSVFVIFVYVRLDQNVKYQKVWKIDYLIYKGIRIFLLFQSDVDGFLKFFCEDFCVTSVEQNL